MVGVGVANLVALSLGFPIDNGKRVCVMELRNFATNS